MENQLDIIDVDPLIPVHDVTAWNPTALTRVTPNADAAEGLTGTDHAPRATINVGSVTVRDIGKLSAIPAGNRRGKTAF